MKSPQANSKSKATGWRIWFRTSLVVVGLISLCLAQITAWLNNVVYRQDSFNEKISQVLLTEESRQSIASSIVDQAFKDKPVADKLLGSRSTSFVSNLLGSDISASVLNRVSNEAYVYLTTPREKDVTIDLTTIRNPLSGIISFVENRGDDVKFSPESIPSEIVLIRVNEVPDLSVYFRLSALLAGPLWLLAASSLLGYVFISKDDREGRGRRVLYLVIGLSLLMLSGAPFISQAISSFVSNVQLRGLVEDLSMAFLNPLWQQLLYTILIAAAVLLLMRFRWVFGRMYVAASRSISSIQARNASKKIEGKNKS